MATEIFEIGEPAGQRRMLLTSKYEGQNNNSDHSSASATSITLTVPEAGGEVSSPGASVCPGAVGSSDVTGADEHGGPWILPGLHVSSAKAGTAVAHVSTMVRPKAFRNFMVSPLVNWCCEFSKTTKTKRVSAG